MPQENTARDPGDALRRALFVLRAKMHGRAYAYRCLLEEQATEADACAQPLTVNPRLRVQQSAEPPDEIRQSRLPLDAFVPEYPIAWVEDVGTRVWMPFWVPSDWAPGLLALRPGLAAPEDLSPSQRRALAMAKILVAPEYEQKRVQQWQDICEAAQSRYGANGYVVLHDMLHALQVRAMRRYYEMLVNGGSLPLGDTQVADRYGLHSETLASFFHPQLTELVSRIAGEPVKPSYLYFASYLPGAALPKHVDREQCEFSISLLIDYSPDPDGPCGWPLFLEHPKSPGEVIAVDLAISDCVFYRGRELAHYRDALPPGHRSTSIFFHYVRQSFAGPLA